MSRGSMLPSRRDVVKPPVRADLRGDAGVDDRHLRRPRAVLGSRRGSTAGLALGGVSGRASRRRACHERSGRRRGRGRDGYRRGLDHRRHRGDVGQRYGIAPGPEVLCHVGEFLRPHRPGRGQPQHPAAQLSAVHLARLQWKVLEEFLRVPVRLPCDQELTGHEQGVEADVDRQEIELGDDVIPWASGALRPVRPRLRLLAPLLQQREDLVPDARFVSKLRQLIDLALYGRRKIPPLLPIGPVWKITLERVTLICLVKRHRIHRSFSYDNKTWVPRSRLVGQRRGTAS